jgi:excisionase family DNA binding protein
MPLHALDPDGPDLTVTEVGKHLRVSKTTVYRYLEQELFPGAYQLEQAWRIPQQAVLDYQHRGREGQGE